MPMAELADAIVQSGRETLENAIRLVEAHPDWRAQVMYGDTGAWDAPAQPGVGRAVDVVVGLAGRPER